RGPGPGPQPERRPECRDAEREVRDPRRGHVQVHEPLRVTLDPVGRRAPQPEEREHDQRGQGQPPERLADLRLEQSHARIHASSRGGPKASIPIAVNSTAKTASSATHGHASDGTPSIAASQARGAPGGTGATTGRSNTGTRVSRTRSPAASTP